MRLAVNRLGVVLEVDPVLRSVDGTELPLPHRTKILPHFANTGLFDRLKMIQVDSIDGDGFSLGTIANSLSV